MKKLLAFTLVLTTFTLTALTQTFHREMNESEELNRYELIDKAVLVSPEQTDVRSDRDLECMPEATYSNPPLTIVSAAPSSFAFGYYTAQRITGFDDPISAIRIFGYQAIMVGSQHFSLPDEDPLTFVFKFFHDNDGMPGEELTELERTVQLNHVATTEVFVNQYPIFYWDYELEAPIQGLPDIFWIAYANVDEDVWFYPVDAKNGIDKSARYNFNTGLWTVGNFPLGICIVPDLSDPGSPYQPTNLEAVADEIGALSALISWNNPEVTFDGEPLTTLDKITLEVNGEVEEEFETPSVGGALSYEYTTSKSGFYKFSVYGTNSEGDGVPAWKKVWVGEDMPAAPQNVVLTSIANGGKVTWEAPPIGLHGGYLNPANTTYTVIRLPDIVVAEDITETEYSDSFNPDMNNYRYKVIASNNIGEGASALSNFLILGAEGILFYQPFDGVTIGQLPEGWEKEGRPNAAWTTVNTNNAGGNAPEMQLNWFPPFNEISRVITNAIDVEGYETLYLHFKHFLNFKQAAGQTLAIQASFDGGDWENLWSEEVTESIGPRTEELYFDVPSDATSMRIGWEYNGNAMAINYYKFDDVVLQEVMDNDLAAIAINGTPTPSVGAPTTYTISVKNGGKLSQNNYIVKLMSEGDIELASLPGVHIDFKETIDFELVWTPTESQEGPNTIYGVLVLDNDENAYNDQTTPFDVYVQPEGVRGITIGDGKTLPTIRIPFDLSKNNSLAQTIYYAEEINMVGGEIVSLAYTNNFASDLTDKGIKIWMGETKLGNLGDGWIPIEALTLVYEGDLDFPEKQNTIVIPFDEAYEYNGDNLVIYTNRVWDENRYSANDMFYATQKAGSKRTIFIDSNTVEIEAENPGSGTISDWHPNTTIFFDTEGMGDVVGTVLDAATNQPIEGAMVKAQGTNLTIYTDAQGEFGLILLPGEYTLTIEKHGYVSTSVSGVTVAANEVTTIDDVELTPIPQYSISGLVKGNDELNLEGAFIKLEGYDTYTENADEDGEFTITGVYEGIYTIAVYMQGYKAYIEEGLRVNANLSLEPIVLEEIIIVPIDLAIEVSEEDEGEALLTWSVAETVFRYDDGTAVGQLGFQNGVVNQVLGAVHHRNAVLNSISWFTTSEGGPHNKVKVWILGLKPDGTPNAEDVLFSQDQVDNTDMQWNSLVLPEPVEAPNGFFMGIGYNGFTGLATDSGTDEDWPFVPNANYGGNVSTGNFFSFESQNFPVNALIRAIGSDLDELRFDVEPKDYPAVSDLVYILNEAPISTEHPTSKIRSFSGYSVYLDDMSTPIATGIEETEYLFTNVPDGNHVAGVQSVHTTTSSDIITISFAMGTGVNVKVDITTNSGDSPEGAEVALERAYNEYYGVADADGEVEFLTVFKGTYKLTVSLENHAVYEQTDIEIQGDTVLDVTLEEIIVAPFGLFAEQLNNNVDVKFSWNNESGSYGAKSFLGYKVYLDETLASGETPIETEEFIFEGLDSGETYTAGVRSVFSSGESNMVTLQFATQPLFKVIGKVVDANNAEAIGGVEVKLDSEVTTTNTSGEFEFAEVLEGAYTLTIAHEGYEPYTQEVNTNNADNGIIDLGDIALIPNTGIMDNALNGITVYPNPFDTHISISITNAEMIKRVLITNSLGQRIMDIKLNGENTINTKALVQGVYIITFEGENGATAIRRIIKR